MPVVQVSFCVDLMQIDSSSLQVKFDLTILSNHKLLLGVNLNDINMSGRQLEKNIFTCLGCSFKLLCVEWGVLIKTKDCFSDWKIFIECKKFLHNVKYEE